MKELLDSSTYTAYFWVNNLYLNDKQYGIQTAHCVSEMSQHEFGKDIYTRWARDGKKIIIYEGTNSGTLRRIFKILQYAVRNLAKAGIEVPHTMFHEDEESLDGALTAVGFIIPNELRNFSFEFYRYPNDDYFGQPYPFQDHEVLPWAVSTKEYHDWVVDRNNLEARMSDPAEGRSWHKPYDQDKFLLSEFGDWMGRQRLA